MSEIAKQQQHCNNSIQTTFCVTAEGLCLYFHTYLRDTKSIIVLIYLCPVERQPGKRVYIEGFTTDNDRTDWYNQPAKVNT